MARRGPQLPSTLLEELGIGSSSQTHLTHAGRRSSNGKLSRKEARKQDRHDRKANHHIKVAGYKRQATTHDTSTSGPPTKRVKTTSTPTPTIATASLRSSTSNTKSKEPVKLKSTQTPLERLVKNKSVVKPVPPKSTRDQQEDAYIAYLEGKLGAHKGKKIPVEEDDGLDGLLDGLEEFDVPDSEDMSLSQTTEDEEDDEELEDGSDEALNTDGELSEHEEWGGVTLPTVPEDSASLAANPVEPDSTKSENSSPPTTVTGHSTRYVPPALRAKSHNPDSEAFIKLKRQIKGLLNKLSEQNISSIIDSLEELYRSHRRNDVSSSLTELLIERTASPSTLLDSHVSLLATLVTALARIMGHDFGAAFIQRLVAIYDEQPQSTGASSISATAHARAPEETEAPAEEAGSKARANLLVLLTALYNFQLVSCVLMYDLIRELLSAGQSDTTPMSEGDVELLLKVVRNSGPQLRQDDPSSLKDIVLLAQARATNEASGQAQSSRTKFMLETLTNLKNNKMKVKTGNAGQTGGAEAAERMKKFLSGLERKRHVHTSEPLAFTLADLRNADTKGKWWVVGAAWAGNPLVDRPDELRQQNSTHTSQNGHFVSNDDKMEVTENRLLRLAKKQGMNTNIRRSIFVVLMSSDDYVDAAERMSQLNLTEVQQREIIRVILHCCGNEKAYNPYYTLLAAHLCASSHAHRFTLQYALWDFLRTLGETQVGGVQVIKSVQDGEPDFGGEGAGKAPNDGWIRNMARLYSWLIAKDHLGPQVFKPVDFTGMKTAGTRFFIELFRQVFFATQLVNPSVAPAKAIGAVMNRETIEQVFAKAAAVPNVATGMAYFLTQHLNKRNGDSTDEFVASATGVALQVLRADGDVDMGSFD